MTALITIRMAGSVVRSCDSKCYGAKHGACNCVCEGENHGRGVELAIATTRTMHALWLEQAKVRGLEFDEHQLDDSVFQPPLFTIGNDMEEPTDNKLGRITTTERGFGRYTELVDSYGSQVSVHQSSNAEIDAVWVTVKGNESWPGNNGSLHLDEERARQVRDGLTAWLREQGADL